jgi:hypothetical protein
MKKELEREAESSLPIIIRLMQRTVSIDDGEYRFELVFFPPPTSLYVIAIETREGTGGERHTYIQRKKNERNSVRCK